MPESRRGFIYSRATPEEQAAARARRVGSTAADRAGYDTHNYVPGYGAPAANNRNPGLTPLADWQKTFINTAHAPALRTAALNPANGTTGTTIPSGMPAAAPSMTPAPAPADPWISAFGGNRDTQGHLMDRGLQSLGAPQINARAMAGMGTNLPTAPAANGTITGNTGPIDAYAFSVPGAAPAPPVNNTADPDELARQKALVAAEMDRRQRQQQLIAAR